MSKLQELTTCTDTVHPLNILQKLHNLSSSLWDILLTDWVDVNLVMQILNILSTCCSNYESLTPTTSSIKKKSHKTDFWVLSVGCGSHLEPSSVLDQHPALPTRFIKMRVVVHILLTDAFLRHVINMYDGLIFLYFSTTSSGTVACPTWSFSPITSSTSQQFILLEAALSWQVSCWRISVRTEPLLLNSSLRRQFPHYQ